MTTNTPNTTKATNYTPEQLQQAVAEYQAGTTVETIADHLGKSVRSVVAKLSREGVYQAKNKAPGSARVKKSDLVDQIAAACGQPAEVFESLEKATHEALTALAQRLKNQ